MEEQYNGLEKKMSKLIMGNDNQTDYDSAAELWDHWISVGGNAFDNAYIFHAGTKELDKKIITNGGRVLGVTALGDTLEAAIKHAYDVTEKISWENKYLRTDIGKKGLSHL